MPHPLFNRSRDNIDFVLNLAVMLDYHAKIDLPGGGTIGYTNNDDFTLTFHQYPLLYMIKDQIHGKNPRTGRYYCGDCQHIRVDFPILPLITEGLIDTAERNWVFLPPPEEVEAMLFRPFFPLGKSFIPRIVERTYDDKVHELRVPDAIESALSEEAFNYFSEVFPQELSSGEFVQGFTQLRSLIPTIEDSISKTFSKGYLSKEFGWDNLLPDLDTLSNLFDIVNDRMEYFKRTFGIPTRLGFSRRDCYQLPHDLSYWTFDEGASSSLGGCVWTRWRLDSYQADFRATAWVLQTLDHVDGLLGFIRVVLGTLGINNPVKTVWELIPFSFVIDWFAGISRHLDNLTRLQPPVGWGVFNVTHSTTVNEVWVAEHYDQGQLVGRNPLVNEIVVPVTRYDRYVGLDFDYGLLDLSQLSTSQLAILAALLLGGD